MSCNNCGGNCCPDETQNVSGVCCILTDSFCGDFEILCDNPTPTTIWSSKSNQPVVGTITATFSQGCGDRLFVTVLRNGVPVDHFSVPKPTGNSVDNSVSRTIQDLFDQVTFQCSGQGSNTCTGSYCLNIHYPSPFPLQ